MNTNYYDDEIRMTNRLWLWPFFPSFFSLPVAVLFIANKQR